MNIIEMTIDSIRPYENNPRINDGAVDVVAASIEQFGWKQPLVIDRDGAIVVGHTRYKAAQKLEMETVPCVLADDLTDEQIKAYRLADNKTAESAIWNDKLLEQELDEILDLDMSLFGFDMANVMDGIMEEEEWHPDVPFTEELLEENNYVVLFFDNSVDWLQAQSVLGIKQVKALDSKEGFQRVGIGRVINGTKFIERLVKDEN